LLLSPGDEDAPPDPKVEVGPVLADVQVRLRGTDLRACLVGPEGNRAVARKYRRCRGRALTRERWCGVARNGGAAHGGDGAEHGDRACGCHSDRAGLRPREVLRRLVLTREELALLVIWEEHVASVRRSFVLPASAVAVGKRSRRGRARVESPPPDGVACDVIVRRRRRERSKRPQRLELRMRASSAMRESHGRGRKPCPVWTVTLFRRSAAAGRPGPDDSEATEGEGHRTPETVEEGGT
jgi:hypothetical protein